MHKENEKEAKKSGLKMNLRVMWANLKRRIAIGIIVYHKCRFN